MKKINLVILMMMVGISIYSMDISTLIKMNIMEKEIEKVFIASHSQIPNGGEPINCEVEVNLFEKSGVVRLIGKNIAEINKLILKSEGGFFDEYFQKIIDLVKNQVKSKDYEVNLIFVSEEENRLIARRYYVI
ncbi:hypothetical protein NRK67_06250 [Fusobacteria bacterium ZRK30]|nr:hypothetical protein NRK67_06250 [Fusobacteria bacterium ZRK30]